MARTAARKPKNLSKPAGLAEEAQPFLHEDIVRGVPAKRVQELIDRGVLPAKAVYRVIPERTFKRRLAKRETLKPSEADAVARLLRVTEAVDSSGITTVSSGTAGMITVASFSGARPYSVMPETLVRSRLGSRQRRPRRL